MTAGTAVAVTAGRAPRRLVNRFYPTDFEMASSGIAVDVTGRDVSLNIDRGVNGVSSYNTREAAWGRDVSGEGGRFKIGAGTPFPARNREIGSAAIITRRARPLAATKETRLPRPRPDRC
jgi:hypothetical protein